jgi:hypothetical protein
MTICSYSSVTIFLFSPLIIKEKLCHLYLMKTMKILSQKGIIL